MNYSHKVNRLDDHNIEVEVSVKYSDYANVAEKILNRLSPNVKITGFRPGKAPKSQIESKIGDDVFSEAVREIMPEVALEIVEKDNLTPITTPEYDILKFSNADGLVFRFSFVSSPEIKLGNLTKLNVKRPEKENISDSEIDDLVYKLFPEHKDGNKPITAKEIKKLDMEGVDSEQALRDMICNRLKLLKEDEAENKYRQDLISAAIKASSIPVPAKLLTMETDQLMKSHIKRIGELGMETQIDEFLAAQGTTQEELRKQKEKEALARLQTEFLFTNIVKEFDIVPTSDEVHQAIHSIEDPAMQETYHSPAGQRYILSVLIEQRAIQKLLELSNPKAKVESKKNKKD